MIKLSASRTYTIPYEDGENSFTVTFKFPNPRTVDKDKVKDSSQIVTNSIVDCSGIIDSDTDEEIKPTTQEMKELIYDLIKLSPDFMTKVTMALVGPTGKNLLTGVMELSTGVGNLPSAEHASQKSASQDLAALTSETQN